ncbi:TPA: TraM recognition domain-containing protein [Streptococcus suis]|nr:TraM recognition domain-containing protein [Streptococcus suis]
MIIEEDNSLFEDERVVIREGVPGIVDVVATYKTSKGEKIGEPINVQSFIQREAVDELVKVGTKPLNTTSKVENLNEIPFTVVKEYDDSLEEGVEKIIKVGKNGQKKIIVTTNYVRGIQDGESIVEEITIEEPQNQVILVGTKTLQKESPSPNNDNTDSQTKIDIPSSDDNLPKVPKIKYKLAAGKTAKSILISCGARLALFDIQELRELMSDDELELDTLGDRKTALFVIISDTDDTFNFVVSILYSQLFNLLCDKADDVYGGRLPVHVRCLLDEFANIGLIPRFEKLIATIRSREISAAIILQAKSQLKAIYKDNADTIIGNCDTELFLGGKEGTTLKELAENLGKETIELYNTSETRSNQKSFGLNYQKLGKELMSRDELKVMDGGKCILEIRGTRPFYSDKYDITKHKHYKLLEDFDKRNKFDIEAYLKNRGQAKLTENTSIIQL